MAPTNSNMNTTYTPIDTPIPISITTSVGTPIDTNPIAYNPYLPLERKEIPLLRIALVNSIATQVHSASSISPNENINNSENEWKVILKFLKGYTMCQILRDSPTIPDDIYLSIFELIGYGHGMNIIGINKEYLMSKCATLVCRSLQYDIDSISSPNLLFRESTRATYLYSLFCRKTDLRAKIEKISNTCIPDDSIPVIMPYFLSLLVRSENTTVEVQDNILAAVYELEYICRILTKRLIQFFTKDILRMKALLIVIQRVASKASLRFIDTPPSICFNNIVIALLFVLIIEPIILDFKPMTRPMTKPESYISTDDEDRSSTDTSTTNPTHRNLIRLAISKYVHRLITGTPFESTNNISFLNVLIATYHSQLYTAVMKLFTTKVKVHKYKSKQKPLICNSWKRNLTGVCAWLHTLSIEYNGLDKVYESATLILGMRAKSTL